MQSAPARRYSRSSSAWPIGPGQRDAVAEAEGGDPLAHDVAVLVVLPDDQRLERDAAAAQLGARLDQHVEALLRHEAADAEHAQRAVARGRGAVARATQAREVGVQAVVDEVDVAPRARSASGARRSPRCR